MINEKLLNCLKNSNDYISGEKLGEMLGVSRSAIWKEIQNLRRAGYDIEAVTNKGYKINNVGDIINSIELNTGKLIGSNIICFDEVDSTNEECKKLGMYGEKEGTVVIADNQSTGKGRLGRTWDSEKGKGVYMSILLKPDISPSKLSCITLCAGLAVCESLKNDFNIKAGIKWPNDIVVNNKKICGILTEMSGQMRKVDFVVVGIGINVNNKNFNDDVKCKASSMFLCTDKRFKRSYVAKSVLNHFDKIYKIFTTEGFLAIKDDYEKNCINIGKHVCVINKYENFEAVAIEVDKNGELVVMRRDGSKTSVFSGEVSIRGVY